jgi:hypothetical protein
VRPPAPAAPAVGEKNKEEADAAPGAVGGRPPFLALFAPIAPREIVESRSEYLYSGAAGVRKGVFVSVLY